MRKVPHFEHEQGAGHTQISQAAVIPIFCGSVRLYIASSDHDPSMALVRVPISTQMVVNLTRIIFYALARSTQYGYQHLWDSFMS